MTANLWVNYIINSSCLTELTKLMVKHP